MASFFLVLFLIIVRSVQNFFVAADEEHLLSCATNSSRNATPSVIVLQFIPFKNESIEDILESTQILSLQLSCHSPHPIEWTFDEYPEAKFWNVTYERETCLLHNSSYFSFISVLEFWGVTAKTVQLLAPKCRKISDNCVRTTVNITSSNGRVAIASNDYFGEDKADGPHSPCSLSVNFDEKRGEFCCSSLNSSGIPRIHLIPCANPTECGSFLLQKKCNFDVQLSQINSTFRSENVVVKQNDLLGDGNTYFHGVAVCALKKENRSEDLKGHEYFYSRRNKHDGKLYSNWDDVAMGDRLSMEIIKNGDYILSGEKFNITCSGVYYFFAKGFHISVRLRRTRSSSYVSQNVTAEFDLASHCAKNYQHMFYEKILFANESQNSSLPLEPIGRKLTVSNFFLPTGDYEVICYAPIWNSTEWETRSESIIVAETSTPVFLDGNRERRLEFEPGDNITCFAKGLPVPNIVWKLQEIVDNKLVYEDVDNVLTGKDKTHSWATIILPLNMTEVYRNFICRAENKIGLAEKHYYVQRTDQSAILMKNITKLGLIIGFAINLVVLYLIYKYIFAKENIHLPCC